MITTDRHNILIIPPDHMYSLPSAENQERIQNLEQVLATSFFLQKDEQAMKHSLHSFLKVDNFLPS